MSRNTKPKPLHKDPEAIVSALIVMIMLALPDGAYDQVVERVTAYPLVYGPVLLTLAARLGLRVVDSVGVMKTGGKS